MFLVDLLSAEVDNSFGSWIENSSSMADSGLSGAVKPKAKTMAQQITITKSNGSSEITRHRRQDFQHQFRTENELSLSAIPDAFAAAKSILRRAPIDSVLPILQKGRPSAA